MKILTENVRGQQKVLKTLKYIIESKKIPHAFLFSGINGIGKHLIAINFIKELYNSNQNDKKLFNLIAHLQEPYIKFVIPLPRGKNELPNDLPLAKLSQDTIEEINSEISKKIVNPYHKISIDKAVNIKISSIREIKKVISLTYHDVKYRAIIISDAHLMNTFAQNALLKSLEEPPPGIIFILITPFQNKLLETIVSRCWVINFEPLLEKDVLDILINVFHYEKQLAVKAAHFSEGSVQKAIELLDNDIIKLLDKTIIILRYALGKRYQTAISQLTNILENNGMNVFLSTLNLILIWFNDVMKNKLQIPNYYFEDYSDTLLKFNEKFKKADFNQIYDNITRLIKSTENNVNLNIIILNIIFELASIGLR